MLAQTFALYTFFFIWPKLATFFPPTSVCDVGFITSDNKGRPLPNVKKQQFWLLNFDSAIQYK
jgi:hypothetical protein